ncbi:hypothetical protein C447_04477 [Halococcus hamelinensis 100A6]|uniref:DUF433 domain-containing protein n=1 Tax=Halococcus hamelinensis 100A6 TaxID=1132509 RepID=M0M826_9EURY|nr:hypothetical protein C447_04477 [Halococcus hamelinensis 100A6]
MRSPDVLGGDPRVEGTRVGVIHIKERLDAGDDPAQIAADYDIDLADVYHALAYYYDTPEEMDEIETRRDAFVEDIRRERPGTIERT